MPLIGGGGGTDPFATATITLTDAQIKALPTTAVQVVPAPGAGQVLVPIFCWMHLSWAADYTNIGDTSKVGIEYATGQTSPLVPLLEALGGQVSNLLVDGASHPAFLTGRVVTDGTVVGGVGQFLDDPDSINAALNLYAANTGTHTGNFTGGNVGNSLKVTVYCAVFTN